MTKVTLSSYYIKIVVLCLLFTIPLHNRNLYSSASKEGESATPSLTLSYKGGREDKLFKYEGESLKYKVSFWLFKNAGLAAFKCEREGDSIVVTIDVTTTGFLDKIVHRHNIYKTTMKIEGETNRLIPIISYKKKIKGEKEKVMITSYDYVNNVREYKVLRNGIIHKKETLELEPAVRDDPISAAYNFRNEIYGRVADGASFEIPAAYKDKTSNYKFDVYSADNSVEYSGWDKIDGVKFAVEIDVNPDVIDSKKGRLIVLYTKDLVPVGFIAKDIIGFGNLYGFRIKDIKRLKK